MPKRNKRQPERKAPSSTPPAVAEPTQASKEVSSPPSKPADTTASKKSQFSPQRIIESIREKILTWLLYLLFVWPIPLLLSPIVYVPCYRASVKPAEFIVDRRERVVTGSGENVQSYYLVWSREGEVFCVSDSWSFLTFDSSDRYGKLKEGARVKADVAGWRVPLLSWYRNVIRVKDVDEALP